MVWQAPSCGGALLRKPCLAALLLSHACYQLKLDLLGDPPTGTDPPDTS